MLLVGLCCFEALEEGKDVSGRLVLFEPVNAHVPFTRVSTDDMVCCNEGFDFLNSNCLHIVKGCDVVRW